MHLSLLPPALAFGCALGSLTMAALLFGTAVRGYHPSHRVFPLFAFCAALYGAAGASAYIGNNEAWEVGAARFEVLVAVAFVLLVQRYAALDLGPWSRTATLAAAAPALVGLFLYEAFGLTGRMRHVWIGWLDYQLPTIDETPVGTFGTLLIVAGVCVPLVRYWHAAARRVPDALSHAIAFTVLFGGAAGQILGGARVVPLFDTIPAATSVALLILARVISRRWRGDLHLLEDLRDQLELKVEQRGRELAEAHRQLARAERLAAVGRLSAGLAHALNNPGAAVVANLEYLHHAMQPAVQHPEKHRAPPPDTAEVVAESLQSARRLTNTVRRLMVFSRAAGAESPADGFAFDLASSVERVVRPLQAQAAGRITLETQTPPGLRVRGRSALLEQALGEVLQNAVAAIPEGQQGGRVAVDASRAGEHGQQIWLKVSDNGVGIAPEVHQSIFEPFATFRSDGGEVGLAMVVGLMRALGGDVRVDSSPGRGSTFTFVLEAEPV